MRLSLSLLISILLLFAITEPIGAYTDTLAKAFLRIRQRGGVTLARIGGRLQKTYSAMATADGEEMRSGRSQQSPLASQRAQSQAPQGRPTYFPLSYKDGFSQWWSGLAPAVTEHKVLSFIPYLQSPPTHTQTGSAPASAAASTFNVSEDESHKATPVTSLTDPHGARRWSSNLVQLPGKNRALNEFSVERLGEEVQNNLVMLHGYGAGLGFFYKNYEALSRAPGWKVYALDMLGMGRSTRPPFKIHAKDREGKIKEAENWFIDALEEWRIKRGIERFTLLGHSLGGYMATAYALKYPGRLDKLILASPVGIPEDPYAMTSDLPENNDSGMVNEVAASSNDVMNGDQQAASDNNNFLNAKSKNEAAGSSAEPKRRPYPKWLTTLWDANISPFSIVRWTGPLGPRFVSGWTSRRFGHLPQEEAAALHDYSYSLFRQKGSGEYALAYVLAPGAFARSPLIRRIQGVGRQWLTPHSSPTPDAPNQEPSANPSASSQSLDREGGAPRKRETGIPVVLMYGSHDWMDVNGGYASEKKLKEAKQNALQNASEEERKKENGSAKVVIIRNAGHHLYLEGDKQFNEVMLEEMAETAKWTREHPINPSA